jgi:hypothetical protein
MAVSGSERVGKLPVERVQIGARLEKRMVKVLKGLAEYHDISLGDLMEGIVLHAFDGEPPFGEDSLQRIAQLKAVYGMDYGIEESHGLVDRVPDGEGE